MFTYEANTRGAPETFEGGYQIGLVVGMITTWAFMIFGIITILTDEVRRHKRFTLEVLTDERKLRTTYNCSEDDMAYYEKEFQDRERLRNMNVKERERLEREALA